MVETYEHPMYQMACRQFDLVADRLEIPMGERPRLKLPKRALVVSLPVDCFREIGPRVR